MENLTPQQQRKRPIHRTNKKYGFVYLLKTGEFYKIGKTFNIKKRVSSIQTANPNKIELIAYKESGDAFSDEQEVHKLLKDYRVRGEWFKLPEELVSSLKLDLQV